MAIIYRREMHGVNRMYYNVGQKKSFCGHFDLQANASISKAYLCFYCIGSTFNTIIEH